MRQLGSTHSVRRRRWAQLLVAGFLSVMMAGCAAPLRKPEVSVAAVELLGVGIVEQSLLLKLRIANPNDAELAIAALEFSLELNGRAVAQGISERPVRIARNAEALCEVRTLTRLAEILKALREARQSGVALTYRIHGRVAVEGYGSLPFDRSAELPSTAFERLRGH